MASEIERKFRVLDQSWRATATGTRMCQGYLQATEQCSVRVRVAGERAWLTVKGRITGISRAEYEYPIPTADADAMLATLCLLPCVDKTRYEVQHGAHLWEIDVFEGANAGLIIAEVELDAEDEVFERPPWLGPEVSGDRRFLNSQLAACPYTTWPDATRETAG